MKQKGFIAFFLDRIASEMRPTVTVVPIELRQQGASSVNRRSVRPSFGRLNNIFHLNNPLSFRSLSRVLGRRSPRRAAGVGPFERHGGEGDDGEGVIGRILL